jgi:glycosyltransferase involved in cell wall biosynthesis
MPDFSKPLVCICVPTYNASLTIRETLLSIVAQDYENLKIKVVDNNSTDDTVAIASSVPDDRIELYRNSVNVGGEGNFNRCIKLGEGKYTAIFHADDIYEPQMVSKQVDFLEINTDAGGVFTEASLIDKTGRAVGVIKQPIAVAAKGPLFDFNSLYKAVLEHSNFLICPSFMARTDIYQNDIKAWRGEMFGSSADLDVWLRILQHHACGILAEPLIRYRISNEQFSAKVRQNVGRADFFRVIDYYQAQGWVAAQLDNRDYINYARLKRRDDVMRAINCLLSGDIDGSYQLCGDVLSLNALSAAWQTRRGLLVLGLGVFIRVSIGLCLTGPAKRALFYFKKKLNK